MTDLPIIQALDQAGTALENQAELIAIYYRSLLKKGVCFELAEKLTIDLQAHLLSIQKPTTKGSDDHD